MNLVKVIFVINDPITYWSRIRSFGVSVLRYAQCYKTFFIGYTPDEEGNGNENENENGRNRRSFNKQRPLKEKGIKSQNEDSLPKKSKRKSFHSICKQSKIDNISYEVKHTHRKRDR